MIFDLAKNLVTTQTSQEGCSNIKDELLALHSKNWANSMLRRGKIMWECSAAVKFIQISTAITVYIVSTSPLSRSEPAADLLRNNQKRNLLAGFLKPTTEHLSTIK
jgi:hypothetical protein